MEDLGNGITYLHRLNKNISPQQIESMNPACLLSAVYQTTAGGVNGQEINLWYKLGHLSIEYLNVTVYLIIFGNHMHAFKVTFYSI